MNKNEHAEPRPSEVEAGDILPCPFCGGEPVLKTQFGAVPERDAFAYECVNRKSWTNLCPVNMRTHYGSEADARCQWNTRDAAATALAQAETKRADEAEAALAELEGFVNSLIDFQTDRDLEGKRHQGRNFIWDSLGRWPVRAEAETMLEAIRHYLAAQKQPTGSEGSK